MMKEFFKWSALIVYAFIYFILSLFNLFLPGIWEKVVLSNIRVEILLEMWKD
jgi:hypothetical protein